MRRLLFLTALLGAVALAANPKASALAKESQRLYDSGKYLEAAETLRQAYDAEPAALYLYNIGRAYDQGGELETAIDYYREYVGLPSDSTDPDTVKKANLHMDRIRTLLARSAAQKQVQDAEKQKLQSDAERLEAETERLRQERRETEAREKAAREKAVGETNVKKIAALAVGGVGVAALGTSLGTAIAAAVNRGKYGAATTLDEKRRLQGETQRTAAACDISLLVGIAASVTAVILYPKGDAPKQSVNVVLGPTAGGVFAGVEGRF